MSSRRLEDLSPETRRLCLDFLRRVQVAGLEVLITCTYRSSEEQDELYARGRTKPGRKVTWVKGGGSRHNEVDGYGKPASTAFDVVPIRGGKLVWGTSGDGLDDDPTDDDTDDLELWERVGILGEAAGLEWGGRWQRSKDRPHFQLPRR